jgi:hypothetical protein
MPDLADLERRIERLEERLQQEHYVPVRKLAAEENEWPDSYTGFTSMMDRRGIPKRTREGRIKAQGSKRTTYVSTYDLE